MIPFILLCLAVAAALPFAAEDRPGFDERRPLA